MFRLRLLAFVVLVLTGVCACGTDEPVDFSSSAQIATCPPVVDEKTPTTGPGSGCSHAGYHETTLKYVVPTKAFGYLETLFRTTSRSFGFQLPADSLDVANYSTEGFTYFILKTGDFRDSLHPSTTSSITIINDRIIFRSFGSEASDMPCSQAVRFTTWFYDSIARFTWDLRRF